MPEIDYRLRPRERSSSGATGANRILCQRNRYLDQQINYVLELLPNLYYNLHAITKANLIAVRGCNLPKSEDIFFHSICMCMHLSDSFSTKNVKDVQGMGLSCINVTTFFVDKIARVLCSLYVPTGSCHGTALSKP